MMYLNYIGFVSGIVELVIDFIGDVANGIENGETEFAIDVLGLFRQFRKLDSLYLFLQAPIVHELLPPLGNDLSFKLL